MSGGGEGVAESYCDGEEGEFGGGEGEEEGEDVVYAWARRCNSLRGTWVIK